MWNLNDTDEFIYKIETNLQISKPILWLPQVKPWGEGKIGRVGITYIHCV